MTSRPAWALSVVRPGQAIAAVAAMTAVAYTALVLAVPTSVPARAFADASVGTAVWLLAGLGCALASTRTTTTRPVWTALSLATGTYAVGDLLLGHTPDLAVGPVAAFDIAYVLSYLGLAAAPVLLLRSLRTTVHTSVWLNSAATGFGALSIAAALVIGPVSAASGPAHQLMPFVYICADAVLLALLSAVAAVIGRLRLMLVGLIGVAGLFAADLHYLADSYLTGYTPGGVTDLGYLPLPLILTGLAIRAPLGVHVAGDVSRPRLELRDLVLPVAGATGSLAVLSWAAITPQSPFAVLSAVASLAAAALSTVLLLRTIQTFYELRAQALTDPLTGIGNRRALDAALAEFSTGPGPEQGSAAALVLLDLDSFRDVNDDIGHTAGDEVLCQLAARLDRDVPEGTVTVRLEADLFGLAVPGTDAEGARRLAEEMTTRLCQPLWVVGVRVRLTASAGVAVAEPGAFDPVDLMRRAHDALQEAKRGVETVVVHLVTPGSPQEISRLQLADELHTALAEGQLVLWFQPQLHVTPLGPGEDGSRVTTVAGCEALVRWEHPDRGLLGPGHVLAAAEHGRLMARLSETVLHLALTACARWWAHQQVPVSVNLSATDLDDVRLPDRVRDLLQTHQLPPWALTLEVVEDTLMLQAERAREVLGRLRRLGVTLSIDDYGTGYSSLAYLHELPIHELKLDRSLTRDVATDPASAAIVRHSIALAHDLGLVVVGEGVEYTECLDSLTALGCDVVQGYLTGRPMPEAAWRTWLDERTAAAPVGTTRGQTGAGSTTATAAPRPADTGFSATPALAAAGALLAVGASLMVLPRRRSAAID